MDDRKGHKVRINLTPAGKHSSDNIHKVQLCFHIYLISIQIMTFKRGAKSYEDDLPFE